MHPFEIDDLLLPTLLIAITSLVVSFRITKSMLSSIILALIKSGLFIVYFSYFFDGTFTFEDDITYINGGIKILDRGINIFNIYDEWQYIKMIGGGTHVGYYLYNAFAFSLFGEFYFSPVALNIIITIFIALVGTKLANREFKFSSYQNKIFFLLLNVTSRHSGLVFFLQPKRYYHSFSPYFTPLRRVNVPKVRIKICALDCLT